MEGFSRRGRHRAALSDISSGGEGSWVCGPGDPSGAASRRGVVRGCKFAEKFPMDRPELEYNIGVKRESLWTG